MLRMVLLLGLALGSLSLSAALAWLGGNDSLPDFSQWPAGEPRKTRFFDFMKPLLEAENERVLAQRARLEHVADAVAARGEAGFFDRRWLHKVAREYGLDPAAQTLPELVGELLLRVDRVPVSLGLAQAAKESGWGTSRFARAGNALFGQRCFEAGCGLVPVARAEGARHEVKTFPSPVAAVTSYVRNLNTHPDYQALRELRARLRAAGKRVTGFTLARALAGYSERRDDYIQEIRQMIRFNGLGPVTDDL